MQISISFMWFVAVIVLQELSPLHVSCQQYQLVATKEGFYVKLSSIIVIHHTTSQPFMYLGSGELSVSEFRGNFKMNDYLTERVALTNYTHVQSNDSDVLELFSDDNTFQATVTLQSTAAVQLSVDISVQQTFGSVNRMWVRLKSDDKEHLYGGGEQYSYFDLKGRVFPIWTREQGVGRNRSELVTFFADLLYSGGDYHTTYYPQPTFISSKKYLCHVDTKAYSVMDFSHVDFHEIQIYAESASILFNYGTDFPDIINKMSNMFGRQPQLPEWLNTGVIIATQGGTNVVNPSHYSAILTNPLMIAMYMKSA